MLKADYPVPYGKPDITAITQTLNKIHAYLDVVTPPQYIGAKTGQILADFSKIDTNTALKKGDFGIVSYEWGVTYGAMYLAASEVI